MYYEDHMLPARLWLTPLLKLDVLRLNEFDGDSNISYCMSQLGGCDLTDAAWF